MGWLRLVGSLKLQVFFAKQPYKRVCILQKRHIILRSLLIVATPYLVCRISHFRMCALIIHTCDVTFFDLHTKCSYLISIWDVYLIYIEHVLEVCLFEPIVPFIRVTWLWFDLHIWQRCCYLISTWDVYLICIEHVLDRFDLHTRCSRQIWFTHKMSSIRMRALMRMLALIVETCDVTLLRFAYVGCLRLVGSLKLYVSFAEYSLFYRALLQKRPMIWRSLLIEATTYDVFEACLLNL